VVARPSLSEGDPRRGARAERTVTAVPPTRGPRRIRPMAKKKSKKDDKGKKKSDKKKSSKKKNKKAKKKK
jgi:hypothetical protein